MTGQIITLRYTKPMEDTNWRVFIGPQDRLQRQLRFVVIRDNGQGQTLALPDGTLKNIAYNSVESEDEWWVFPIDALQAIHSSFTNFLGAVESPKQLRADYEFERSRTTRLLDTIIGLVEKRK